MNIASATREHARGIASVHVRSWRAAYAGILEQAFLDGLSVEDRAARWEDILQRAESRTVVACRGDGVVGFVSYGRCRDDGAGSNRGEIWALYAEPESWGQGVGRDLLAHALQDLRAVGYSEVSLWVLSRNERGLGFYRSFGFSRVAGSETVFELGGRQVEEVCLQLRNDA